MAISYTPQMLVERTKKHINDGFPGNDWNVSDNEILLYLYSAIPSIMKGQMFENAKVGGILDTPEAYLVTYQFNVTSKNAATNEWYVTLPQTPLALPNGYQITDAYISAAGFGRGQAINFVSAKRVSYRSNLPQAPVVYGRIENNKAYFYAYNGASLLNQTLNIQMPISRFTDVTEVLRIPDDTIQGMFEYAVKSILQRYSIPKDIIEDSLPAGNKSS